MRMHSLHEKRYSGPKIWKRMIALVDMNAFFASIEQRDHFKWRSHPVGITNGVTGTCIITCSYEARAFGIKTGMRVKEAKRLCPKFIQIASRPYRYAEVSTAIMQALRSVSPDIEIFSVDEAFLDLTHCQRLYRFDPECIGRLIKQTVNEASGILCSVGISGDKTTAKWAAKQVRPDGLTIVPPWEAEARLASHSVTELNGISTGIARFLAAYKVFTCGDMKKIPISVLARRFGNPGRRIWLMAQGKDPESLMQAVRAPRTMGHGKVMPPNTRSEDTIRTYLLHMSEKLGHRLRVHDLEAQIFAVSLLTNTGWLSAKYRTLSPCADGRMIYLLCDSFIQECWHGEGVHQVHVVALDPRPQMMQGDLFAVADTQQYRVNQVRDAINHRYGEFTISDARLLNKSDMPNVISPAWKPDGHRNTLKH